MNRTLNGKSSPNWGALSPSRQVVRPTPSTPPGWLLDWAAGFQISRTALGCLSRVVEARAELDTPAALTRWLDPKLSDLTAPDGMLDRDVAVDRIATAIRSRERICVFGDYDCDGITATSILTEMIRALGGEVIPTLATRAEGAYGLSDPALKRIFATGATLLITCDCGSSDHPRIDAARGRGVDVIVIDHHLVPTEALPANAFLNPHRPGCRFPYKHLASCGLALNVGAGLRAALGAELELRRWLDLVAIGTVADVAPLVGDNRALVRAGLRAIGARKRPGLDALLRLAKVGERVTSEDIGFRIAPRLNAPGRLGDPDDTLNLLLSTGAQAAEDLARTVEGAQQSRREIQELVLREAYDDVLEGGYHNDPAIVLARPGWHPGIVGIVAGRVAEATQKPTVVIAIEGNTGRGSARGPAGARLHDALTACGSELEGFGGHQAAAGVHVRADRIGAFRDAFRAACAGQAAVPGVRSDDPTENFQHGDTFEGVVRDFERFEPFGETNPAPRLLFCDATVIRARDLKGHLKVEFEIANDRLSGIFFDQGARESELLGAVVDVVGSLRRSSYSGQAEVQVLKIEVGRRS